MYILVGFYHHNEVIISTHNELNKCICSNEPSRNVNHVKNNLQEMGDSGRYIITKLEPPQHFKELYKIEEKIDIRKRKIENITTF